MADKTGKYAVARRYPRAIVNLATDVVSRVNGRSGAVPGRFLILGGGGAWIEMSGDYPIDSEIRLSFRIPPDAADIACRAVVRNRLARRGAGVEFVDLSDADRARVMDYVERCTPRRRPSSPPDRDRSR